jgi:hypothetical protein
VHLADVKKAEEQCAKQMTGQRPLGAAKPREKDSAFDHVSDGHQPETDTAQEGNRGARGDEEAAEEEKPDDDHDDLGSRHQQVDSNLSIRG